MVVAGLIFVAGKDCPILFTAIAPANELLTLDKVDFATKLGGLFYGMSVLLPYPFLERDSLSGRLVVGTKVMPSSNRPIS